MPGEWYLPDSVVSTVKFGGISGIFGFGQLVLVNGNMNSEIYVTILDNSFLPYCCYNSELALFF